MSKQRTGSKRAPTRSKSQSSNLRKEKKTETKPLEITKKNVNKAEAKPAEVTKKNANKSPSVSPKSNEKNSPVSEIQTPSPLRFVRKTRSATKSIKRVKIFAASPSQSTVLPKTPKLTSIEGW